MEELVSTHRFFAGTGKAVVFAPIVGYVATGIWTVYEFGQAPSAALTGDPSRTSDAIDYVLWPVLVGYIFSAVSAMILGLSLHRFATPKPLWIWRAFWFGSVVWLAVPLFFGIVIGLPGMVVLLRYRYVFARA